VSGLTFNFCGVNAEDLSLTVNDIRRAVTPEITENVQSVPGMTGELFLGNSYGKLIFEIDVTLKADDARDRAQKLHDLAALFTTFGSGEWPMIFSNDAEYTYYGHFTNISLPQKILEGHPWVKFTLTFACSDPKGYGAYESHDMTENPIIITPNGTAECYPIFTCIPRKDVTYITITDQDENYVFIGENVDPDTGSMPIDKEPLVFHDTCGTMANWETVTQETLTFTPENGVVGGAMRSDKDALKPALDSKGHPNFGAPVKDKWHGPMVRQWLNGQYQDYRVRVWLWNNEYYARAHGKVECYLLDSLGNAIGKITLKDNSQSKKAIVQVQVINGSNFYNIHYGEGNIYKKEKKTVTIKVKNGTVTVEEKGKKKTVQKWKTLTLPEDPTTDTYTNFYGYIQLQKIGNKFRVEIMKCDSDHNPVWDKPVVTNWTDTKNIYNQKLAGVAVYIAKWDIEEDTANPPTEYQDNGMAVSDIKVWEIIDGGNGATTNPTIIARAGDEIKINCEDRTIYKNGAIFMENFYIGSKFPTLQGGVPKTFAFDPGLDDAEWYYEYRPTTQ
jgi:predicted phage tail component-like protein